jgi:hypothetical protein
MQSSSTTVTLIQNASPFININNGDELQNFGIIDLIYKRKDKHAYYGEEDRQWQTNCQHFKRPQHSYERRERQELVYIYVYVCVCVCVCVFVCMRGKGVIAKSLGNILLL